MNGVTEAQTSVSGHWAFQWNLEPATGGPKPGTWAPRDPEEWRFGQLERWPWELEEDAYHLGLPRPARLRGWTRGWMMRGWTMGADEGG